MEELKAELLEAMRSGSVAKVQRLLPKLKGQLAKAAREFIKNKDPVVAAKMIRPTINMGNKTNERLAKKLDKSQRSMSRRHDMMQAIDEGTDV